MANGWTQARRDAQRLAIRRWKSWEQSTGPRTKAGKARVARNAYKGAQWRELREFGRAIRALFSAQRETVERLEWEASKPPRVSVRLNRHEELVPARGARPLNCSWFEQVSERFDAQFNGDKAKLVWRVGINAEKTVSETYDLVEILDPPSP